MKDATTRNAEMPITTHDDGRWIHTAIVAAPGDTGSLAVVDQNGVRLAGIHISYLPDDESGETLIVDVIDVDERYSSHRMLGFANGKRTIVDVSRLTSVDFRRNTKGNRS